MDNCYIYGHFFPFFSKFIIVIRFLKCEKSVWLDFLCHAELWVIPESQFIKLTGIMCEIHWECSEKNGILIASVGGSWYRLRYYCLDSCRLQDQNYSSWTQFLIPPHRMRLIHPQTDEKAQYWNLEWNFSKLKFFKSVFFIIRNYNIILLKL